MGLGLTAPGPPGPAAGSLLPREFFDRPAPEVAPALLGCVLARRTADGLVAAVIVETEAYTGATDPASHAFRGRTARNGVMFGPPGHSYVYFTYGMHFCVNLVCQLPGTASAVLLRAGRVTKGVALATARRSGGRPSLSEVNLARGPARLCQALSIDRGLDGADVCDPDSPLRVLEPAAPALPAASISRGPRVGVSQAAEVPWRFWITGEPAVSAYRAAAPRRSRTGAPAGRAGQPGAPPRPSSAAGVRPDGVRPHDVHPHGVRPDGVHPDDVYPDDVYPDGVHQDDVHPVRDGRVKPVSVRPADDETMPR
jgi:DNA-3-methyladenine glycosylase